MSISSVPDLSTVRLALCTDHSPAWENWDYHRRSTRTFVFELSEPPNHLLDPACHDRQSSPRTRLER
jgi:hypothetical protein